MKAVTDPLVTAEWLQAALASGQVRVLDASWHAPSTGRQARKEFVQGHIPGAHFLDLDEAAQPGAALSHTLPSPAHLAHILAKLGIVQDETIVLYDNAGMAPSARAWWMLKTFGIENVYVLDGGQAAWLAAGIALEKGGPAPVPGPVKSLPPPDSRRLATIDDVRAAAASGRRVIDARAAARFNGMAPEPKSSIPRGHIADSLNLPYLELLDGSTGMFLPVAQLASRFDALKLRQADAIICSCGSGVTACVIALALERLGYRNVAVYDGSWTEWAQQNIKVEH